MGTRSRITFGGACFAIQLLLSGLSQRTEALPAGRAWMPVERLFVPGFSYHPRPILETDAYGRPVMFVPAWAPNTKDGVGLAWSDSGWSQRWRLGSELSSPAPVLAPGNRQFLVWAGGVVPQESCYVFWAEVIGDRVTAPDTVAKIWSYPYIYQGAVSPSGRRWIVLKDRVQDPKLFYADSGRAWTEGPWVGTAAGQSTIAALDDTTALIVQAEWTGLTYATTNGVVWNDGGALMQYGSGAAGPTLRPRPDGGVWLTWGDYGSYLGLGSFANGAWSPPESLQCSHLDPRTDYTHTHGMSRDEGVFPVIAWASYNGRGGVNQVCASVPTDTGYAVADELWTFDSILHPTAALDANGDAWVAWWTFDTPAGTYWTHTHTTAIASSPQVESLGTLRRVRWVLSEPAPETRWAVLRARGAGKFERVARVRAGVSLDLEWIDSTAAPTVVRYRIRRECFDTRYQWLSEETRWRVRNPTPLAFGPVPTPFLAGASVQLRGAEVGSVELRLFDLQGREVRRQSFLATGFGEDGFQLDLATPLPAGVYFLRARDSAGQESRPVRLVLLH